MPKKHSIARTQVVLLGLALWMFLVYVAFPLDPIFAYLPMIIAVACLATATLLETVAYEETLLEKTGFSEEKSNSAMVNEQNEPTPQARRLHEALNRRGIHNELEYDDGYKHVDISIPWAKLNLEIDGKYHLTDPEHLFRDLKRDSYSHLDGIETIRIPNFYVDNHLDRIADAIAVVARKNQERGIPTRKPREIRW